jgi:cytochrome c-type biogenesis protein CcmH
MKKALFIVTLLLITQSTVSMAKAVEEEALDLKVREVAKTLRCTVCQNESIWESNALLARQMRELIRERLMEGQSPEEIRAYFLSRYGDYILLEPRKHGLNWLLWGGPFLLLLFGGIMLYRTLARWVRETPKVQSDEIPPLDESSRRRIEQELRSLGK